MVLYHYDTYFDNSDNKHITLNKDFVSTETFKNNYPKYKYDSYILGNSRSMYYHVDQWGKYIHSNKCFHFDASGESLYGIERKIDFLDRRGVNIKNVLIVFDAYSCKIINNDEDHIKRKDPDLSGENKFLYQLLYLRDFFDIQFIEAYISLLITHKASDEMVAKFVLSNTELHYELASNEVSFPKYEELIERNRDSFYIPRMKLFYKRDTIQSYIPPVIEDKQKKLFNNIKRIFDKHKTNYRIVISPLYDQKKIDSTDLNILYSIFGKQNVFDFSGINDITTNIYNYYEDSHYRPFVANRIMNIIYANDKKQ